MSLCGQSLCTLAIALLIGLCFNQNVARATTGAAKLLDDDGHTKLNLDSVANTVCTSNDAREGQLSRISTIEKLIGYFESIDERNRLHECKNQHEDALHLLNEVLTTGQQNVCSDEKLDLIEQYHNQYVSTQLEHVNTRREQNKATAPYLLNLFFMHYVLEVDALCKRTLINNLEWDLKDKFGADINDKLFLVDDNKFSDNERSPFRNIFKGVMGKFTDLYAVEKYDDVVMIWDLLKGSVLSQDKDQEIRDDYDEVTGEPIRLIAVVKSGRYLNKIKEHCHYNLKPIYSKLITPIIRLADLGYANTGEQFKIELDELRSNNDVKRWYATTQLCEALIPVKFHEDPSLGEDEVNVISKEEAAQFVQAAVSSSPSSSDESTGTPPTKLEYEPQTNTMVGLDKLESVESGETQKMVKNIKSNVSTRDRAMSRAIVHLMRNLKQKFAQSRVGKFFFSKKTTTLENPKGSSKENHYDKEDIGNKFAASLDQLSEQDLLKMDGATWRMTKATKNAKGIGKRRRHHRKGDVDMVMEMRAEAISYKRTKTWSEIFSGWGQVLSVIAPSRMQIIIAGSVLIGLLVIIVMCSLVAMMVSAG